jgi:hypothetical protein
MKCEIKMYSGWHFYECDKKAKWVLFVKADRTLPVPYIDEDKNEVFACGTHKNKLIRRSHHIGAELTEECPTCEGTGKREVADGNER